MSAGKWAWSTDEERFAGDVFDTRDEAIADAVRELNPGERFWTGQYADIRWSVHARHILEDVGEQAFNEAGEASEDWPADYSRAEEGELSARLTETLRKWFEEKNDRPHFWRVADVKEHVAPVEVVTP